MPADIQNPVRSNRAAALDAFAAKAGIVRFEGGAVSSKALKAAQAHRSEQVSAFVQSIQGGQREALQKSLSNLASPELAKEFETLFGKDASLLVTVKDLMINKDNPAHVVKENNMKNAHQVGLIARGMEDLKEAVKLAEDAPRVGQNFAGFQKKLEVTAGKLLNNAKLMPDTPEGQLMQKLATSMADVCQQKSALIATNQQRLDSLVNYDAAIDAVTQKMDALDATMHSLSAGQPPAAHDLPSAQQRIQQYTEVGNQLVALQDQYTALEAERHNLMHAQDEQEQAIAQMHPALQNQAHQKLKTMSAAVGKTVADAAAQERHDLIAQTYSSALDLLNARIAHHYGFNEKKTALTLMIYRDNLRAAMNQHLQKTANDHNDQPVNNVVPGATKRLGLVDRVRVKFQAKAAMSASKRMDAGFPAKLTKLDAKTTMAAYLQGAFRKAGLSGADLPSKASLRGQLQSGINSPKNFDDFGKVVDGKPELARAIYEQNAPKSVVDTAPAKPTIVQSEPAAIQPPKPTLLQNTLADSAKQFDDKASSVYTRLMLKASRPNVFLKNASLPELFMARQQATKLFMDPAVPNQDVHKKHRDLIDQTILSRLNGSDATVNALHIDEDKVVLGNGRLMGEREVLDGLAQASHFKNVAPAAFYKMEDVDAALAAHLQNNVGPVYGVLNQNGHWLTVIADKTADGRVNSYVVDSKGLQDDNNKALPNGCGPLQIMMHAELSKRLQMNPNAGLVETMVDIQDELQATDKQVLYSAVLQQRMESLEQVVASTTSTAPRSAANFAAQIDEMAEAFNI
jgi:hypothetical protein